MNIEEAKHILEGRKSILINSSMPDTSLITAIDIVLNELDNIDKKIQDYDWLVTINAKKNEVIQKLCEQLEERTLLTAEEWKRVAWDIVHDKYDKEDEDEE